MCIRDRSGGAATITGYRIFYDGREILFLPPTDIIASINLNLGQGTKVGQALSIHAESSISQLPSELISVTISSELFLLHKSYCVEFSRSFPALKSVPNTCGDCNSGIAITLSVVFLLVVFIATVVVVILVFVLKR